MTTIEPAAALLEQLAGHLGDLGIVQHDERDDVGGGADLAHRRGSCRTGVDQRGHRLGPHVVHRQPARPSGQMRRHRRAHVAQPDEAQPFAHTVLGHACAARSASSMPCTASGIMSS